MVSVQIAVTGGTGHLGHCLIQNLLKQGYLVTALYRKSIPEFEHSNLSWIQGDITDHVSLELLVEKASVMIHCASLISIGDQDEKEVYRINVDGTKTILKACQDKKIRLIYIS
ncbi:MAG: NAD-dependent epimerase/dehydratase family protein, partial [Lutimonas sp.]